MKSKNILYWTFTLLLIPMFGIGAVIAIAGSPAQVELLESLGYPEYLLLFMSVMKILALVAILTPYFPRMREWAYAGLTFDVVVAIYSLLTVRNSLTSIIIPVIALGLVIGSYMLHHQRRKWMLLERVNV